MDLTSGIAAAKAGLDITKGAHAGWGWLAKRVYGEISIIHPSNRDHVGKGSVDLEGKHNNPKGIFWVVSPGKDDEYWIKNRIVLHPDGRWKERIHIGDHAGPRPCFISVVWVSSFMNSMLSDIRKRSTDGNIWFPLNMKPPKDHFSTVQSIVLEVLK